MHITVWYYKLILLFYTKFMEIGFNWLFGIISKGLEI